MLNLGLSLHSFGFLEGQEDGETDAPSYEPHCWNPADHGHLHSHQLDNNENSFKFCLGVGFGTVLYRSGAECHVLEGKTAKSLSLLKVKDAAIDFSGVHYIQDNGYYIRKLFTEDTSKDIDSSETWSYIHCGESHIILVNGMKLAHLYTPASGAVSMNIRVKEVSCGKEHVILLDESGCVFTVGNGSRGQLGHGDLESQAAPRVVDLLQGLVCVRSVAGGWHSCVVTEGSDLFTWGWNQSGQLGILEGSKSEDSTSPANRESKLGQAKIVEESDASVIPTAPGIVDCDLNDRSCDTSFVQNFLETESKIKPGDAGVLGDGEYEPSVTLASNSTAADRPSRLRNKIKVPQSEAVHVSMIAEPTIVDIDGGRSVLDIACGSRHTVALTVDQRLYVWGWNKYGQLGLKEPEYVYEPTLNSCFQRKGLTVRRVHAGYWTTVVQTQSLS